MHDQRIVCTERERGSSHDREQRRQVRGGDVRGRRCVEKRREEAREFIVMGCQLANW
jgi:hypothetical protein